MKKYDIVLFDADNALVVVFIFLFFPHNPGRPLAAQKRRRLSGGDGRRRRRGSPYCGLYVPFRHTSGGDFQVAGEYLRAGNRRTAIGPATASTSLEPLWTFSPLMTLLGTRRPRAGWFKTQAALAGRFPIPTATSM